MAQAVAPDQHVAQISFLPGLIGHIGNFVNLGFQSALDLYGRVEAMLKPGGFDEANLDGIVADAKDLTAKAIAAFGQPIAGSPVANLVSHLADWETLAQNLVSGQPQTVFSKRVAGPNGLSLLGKFVVEIDQAPPAA